MEYFDAHTHLNEFYTTEADADRFEADLKAAGIGRVYLLPSMSKNSENEHVLKFAEQKPNLVVPGAAVRLGKDSPAFVDEAKARGFKGLKFIAPPKRYDEREYFPIYERAEKLGLPCLFHAGILGRRENEPVVTSFDYMTPGALETISRAFPGLTIIMAHLSNPLYEVAAEIIRWNKNIYYDVTGSTLEKMAGRLGRFKEILWWEGALDRLLFGTDMPPKFAPDCVRRHSALLEALGVKDKERLENIFHKTAEKIFGITPA